MPFKTDKQRKGFFASQNNLNNSHNTYYASKNKRVNQVFRPHNRKRVIQITKNPSKNYKKYWENEKDLKNHLKAVNDLKKNNSFKWDSVNITAKVYKDMWKIPLNEARALALSLDYPMKKEIAKSKTLDSDGDGVVNAKDCKPFDPKKQGFFHDMQIKLLKKKEEFVEGQREREQKKLNDLRDKVKEKTAVSLVTENKRKQEMAQKQAVIDEIKAEKNKLSKIRAENEKAKRELEKGTFTEKIKQLSVKAYNSGIDYLSEKKKPKRRKTKTKKVKTKIVYVDVNTGKPIKHKRKKKKKEVYYGYRF